MSSGISITGSGAVSPAGWTAEELYTALLKSTKFTPESTQRAEDARSLLTYPVPENPQKMRHPRLRRVSPVTRYAVSAALEALGPERLQQVEAGELRLGVIVNVTNGCVAHTRRFYEEALEDPATASPILFPETVFNSPASHIAAVIGTTELNYTLLGDPTQFISGIDLAALWLESDLIDGCLVVTAEELDWLSSEAIQLFEPDAIVSGGAGALYLERSRPEHKVQLAQITRAYSYSRTTPPETAQALVVLALPMSEAKQLRFTADPDSILPAERQWNLNPTLGFSLVTPSWQTVAAYHALLHQRCQEATVTGFGTNQQAIGLCLRLASS